MNPEVFQLKWGGLIYQEIKSLHYLPKRDILLPRGRYGHPNPIETGHPTIRRSPAVFRGPGPAFAAWH